MPSEHGGTRDTDQATDLVSSLPVALSTIAMIALAGLVCSLAKVHEIAVESILGIAAILPSTVVLAVRRFRTSPTSRAIAVARDGLATNPIIVVLLLGSISFLVDTVLGVIIGGVAGATSGAVLNIGGNSQDAQHLYNVGFDTGSLIFAQPIFFVIMVFVGRRAGHYLHSKQYWWLFLAGGVYWILRATVLLIVGRYVGENPLQAVLNPLPVAPIVVFASWLGALWARRSQDPFVGARLLGQLRLADRQAALDLLRESVTSKAGRADLGEESQFNLSVTERLQ